MPVNLVHTAKPSTDQGTRFPRFRSAKASFCGIQDTCSLGGVANGNAVDGQPDIWISRLIIVLDLQSDPVASDLRLRKQGHGRSSLKRFCMKVGSNDFPKPLRTAYRIASPSLTSKGVGLVSSFLAAIHQA